MRESGLSRRYAQAVFKVAKERGVTPAVGNQLAALVALLKDERPVLDLLGSPKVSPERKEAFLRATLEGQVDPTLLEFLLLVRRKGRFGLLGEIASEYTRLLDKDQGILKANVTTAVELDGGERDRLARVLEARTGLKIVLEEEVDPSVIGGLVVILGGQIIDDSVRHHLEVLRNELRAISLRESAKEV